MSENTKSVIIALLVVAGVAAGITILTRQGLLHRRIIVTRSTVSSPSNAVIPTRSRPALIRGRDDKGSKHPRLEYAEWLERGLRDKGRTLTVRATGQDHAILELSWPEDQVDTEHMEQLKKAGGFFERLRFLAFSRLVMRVGSQQVWSKDIE